MMLDMMTRGRDATGLLTVTNGRHKLRKAPQPAGEFLKNRPGIGANAQTALIHTRAATQGTPAVAGNNHPIAYGNIIGIHNGVIYNDDQLFRDNKWERKAEVDSEAIFAALAHEGDPVKALEMIRGWMAIAWVDVFDKAQSTIHLAKGDSSPLHLSMTATGSLFWASTRFALDELIKWEYVPEYAMEQEVRKEGWILSYDPRGEGSVEDRFHTTEFKVPAFTRYASSWEEDYAWLGRQAYWDLDKVDFATTAGRSQAVNLRERVLGTHSQTVDTTIDPFDDVNDDIDDDGIVLDGLMFTRAGDRVVNKRGMIGTVVAPDNEAGECIVEWDASVELLEDLELATNADEEHTNRLYTEHLSALGVAR